MFAIARSTRFAVAVALAVVTALGAQASVLAASVDPDTLVPVPPNAECRVTGQHVICETAFVASLVNEPILDFDLPCGMLYETIEDVRRGIRWYDADTLTIVKRAVFQNARGYWSLSPTGDGPRVTLMAQANWVNTEFPDPLDEETWPTTSHGDAFKLSAPGYGVIVQFAGQDETDGTHHGVARWIDDPAVAAELCAALTGA